MRIINLEIIKEYWHKHPYCEICGSKKTESPHHITLKSQGGDDLPADLITLCGGFSKNQHHLCAHYQKEPYLTRGYLYKFKDVCETYPNNKIITCPLREIVNDFSQEPRFLGIRKVCKWFGKCKFTYNQEYKKRLKKLKELENAKGNLSSQKERKF